MKQLNFSNRLSQNYALLSKKERQIGEFILANRSTITQWTIKDLARLTGSSNATISRFCQKLNYTSFGEFKTLILQENDSDPDQTMHLPERIASYYTELIHSSMQLINSEEFKALLEQVRHANKILICGLGSSGLSAEELKGRLVRMGIAADLALDPHTMLMSASLLTKRDLLIAISNSGKSQSVIEACIMAKKEQTPVYAITNRNHTPLTETSDKAIFTSENLSILDKKFINSQISIVFFLDVLCYALLEDPSYLKNRQKTVEVLDLDD